MYVGVYVCSTDSIPIYGICSPENADSLGMAVDMAVRNNQCLLRWRLWNWTGFRSESANDNNSNTNNNYQIYFISVYRYWYWNIND